MSLLLNKMSCKTIKSSSNGTCEGCSRHNCTLYSSKSVKMNRPVKKVIPSKKLECSKHLKSFSSGVVINNRNLCINPKKVTKSDIHFKGKISSIDFCAKCGDSRVEKSGCSKSHNCATLDSLCDDIKTQVAIDEERNNSIRNKKKLIQQFYKNEKFKPSTSSVKDIHIKKGSKILDPIKEAVEGQVSEKSSDTVFEIYSTSIKEIGNFDPEDEKSVEDLKNFRKKNYFECHSAKSRLSTKGSVTSLNNHKCVFRFYLNDRLFPVPLHTDSHNSIRCVECNLPLEEIDSNLEQHINGTVQTKVKIGNEVQDMILMLPVKKPLIVEERRRVSNAKGGEVLYFGIIKLNYSGDSIFNRTVPNDSLALRYQKGYKEFVEDERYHYEKVQESDVIVI